MPASSRPTRGPKSSGSVRNRTPQHDARALQARGGPTHRRFRSSGDGGNRTHHKMLAKHPRRSLGTCVPVRAKVRPGIEPGLPPYQRGVPPEHLQTDRPLRTGRSAAADDNRPGRAGLSFPQPPSARPPVAGAGVEPARCRGLSAAALPSLRTRPSRSSRGGNRTRRHQALDLTALPVCVPGHTAGRRRCLRRTDLQSVQ